MGSLVDSATAQFQADVNARLAAAGADVQAQIYAKTGVDTSQKSVAQGASSAVSLLKNGYNPDSSSDNANLVHVIAGGACLIPGAGPILGAAIEGLWQIGNTIACPVSDAFASIGFGVSCNYGCSTSGNWTTTSVLASQAHPAMPTGSFASLVLPALATAVAAEGNCKGGFIPSAIVSACANIWNAVHAGPAIPYLIPPLLDQFNNGGLFIFPFGMDSDYAIYGFGPASAAMSGSHFTGAALPSGAGLWTPFPLPAPSPFGTLAPMQADPPQVIMLNGGALVSGEVTSGGSLGRHAAALASGGIVGGLLYAWVTGKSIDAVMTTIGKTFGAWVAQASGEVTQGVAGGAAALEKARRRRR